MIKFDLKTRRAFSWFMVVWGSGLAAFEILTRNPRLPWLLFDAAVIGFGVFFLKINHKPSTELPPIIAPTNVRIVWSDIGEEPVDCFYNGWIDGQHNWVIQNRSVITRTHFPVDMRIDVIPAKTSITFEGDMVR